MESLCRELLAAATRPVIGVGIASPGVIDLAGTVVQAPNRGWYGMPLATRLTDRLGVPVHVANDANTRALGEFTYGSAAGSGCMVVTIGEGVGAGIVVDGALVLGRHHAAGEIGHLTVLDGDLRDELPLDCACGRSGCLETVLSVPALRRRIAGLTLKSPTPPWRRSDGCWASPSAPVVSALDLAEVLLSGPPELLDGLCGTRRSPPSAREPCLSSVMGWRCGWDPSTRTGLSLVRQSSFCGPAGGLVRPPAGPLQVGINPRRRRRRSSRSREEPQREDPTFRGRRRGGRAHADRLRQQRRLVRRAPHGRRHGLMRCSTGLTRVLGTNANARSDR